MDVGRFRQRLQLLVLVSVSLLGCLLCSELVLRFLGYHTISFRSEWLSPSPYVLKESWLSRRGRSIKWYRNNFEKRPLAKSRMGIDVEGEFYPFEKGSKKRILAIGDSGTFGLGVKRHEAWPNQLGIQLGDEYEVFNFGFPGALLSDTQYYLRHFLLKYKPDIIILCVFMANDINQSIYFDRDLYQRSLHLEELPGNLLQEMALFKFFKLMSQSDMAIELEKKIGHYDEEVFVRPETTLFAGDFLEGEYMLYQKKQSEQIMRAYENVGEILRYMQTTAASIGSRLIVTNIPTRSYLEDRFTIQPWTSEVERDEYFRKRGVTEFTNLDFDQPNRKLKTLMKDLGVEFYDSSRRLKTLHENTKVLLRNDDHPSETGHAKLAEFILQSFSI